MKNTHNKSESETLRQKAESLLKKKTPTTVSSLSEAQTLKLIYELQVHQIELEMQNKELSCAKEKAETDANKYAELYDFAPSGYFTLSKDGTITEANISGATMLGKDRSQLSDNRFGFFVSNDTKPIFNLFLDKVFSSKANESCDVTLSTRGNLPMFVHLTGIVSENGEQCLVSMVDITDSRIMTALQQSEQRFRAVVEWSPYSIVIHRDLKIIYVNPAAIKMFGASSGQDFVGTKILDWVHPDCHQIVLDRIRRGIDDGINAPLTELKYVKFDGTIIDVEVQGTPITYDGVPCIHAAMRDITERKQVEAALREVEKKLRKSEKTHHSLFEISLQGIVYQDSEGLIVNANPAAQRILGLTLDQMQGRTSSDPNWRAIKEDGSDFPGEEHPATVSLKTGKVIQNVIMGIFNPADEIVHWINISASPLFKDGESAPHMVYTVFEDITERRQAVKELQQSHARYSSMISNISDVIAIMDADGFKKYESPNLQKFFGWLPEDNAGRSAFSFAHPDDIPNVQKVFYSMLGEDNSVKNMEFRFECKDGSYKPIELIAYNLLNDPLINGVMVSFRDITERKQAADKLQQSHARYTSMISNISDVIGIMDADGIMTYKSPNIEKWFGWLPEDHVGISGFSTVHPDDLDRVGKVFYSLLEKDNAVKTLEFRYLCKDGSYKPIELTASNLLTDPFIRGVLLNYRDITDRKQIEEELEQTATRLALATTAGGVGVWDFDIVNNVMVWDDQMIALYGIDKKNFSGAYQAWQEGLHPDDLLRGDQEIQMAISGKKEFNTEFRVVWPDGTIRYIRALAVVQRDDSGKALHMIGTNWDITVQKLADKKLRESEENLQKINAEKDKFFSIISHDLRGPFNGFLGLSRMLAEDLHNLTQEEIQKMAGSMRESATNLFNLLENLLEWSRMQQGGIIFNPESIWLMSIMNESMRPVIDSADKKGVEIRYEIQADLEVFADEYMLASTMRNLASNAVKFTLKGGKVTIAAKSVPGHSVEISIRDTGIGMNHEMVHDLFRLDVQTNRRGTENEPSSGLGLLLCKDFVEKHGGKLWVESEVGKGSVFYFTIPCHAEGLMKTVISNSVSDEEKEVQIKRIKILIAEDDEISASLISAMVDKYSYEVLHVKTGDEAIHACRNNPDIDLVLMDVNLTGMDGYEATRQIRQFNNDVVIIAQTAFSLKFDRVMAILAGCNDYISKPISISELKGLIRKYFTV